MALFRTVFIMCIPLGAIYWATQTLTGQTNHTGSTSTATPSNGAQAYYRWRGPDGQLHYGDTPPQGAREIIHSAALRAASGSSSASSRLAVSKTPHFPPATSALSALSTQPLNRQSGSHNRQHHAASQSPAQRHASPTLSLGANGPNSLPPPVPTLSGTDFSSVGAVYNPSNIQKLFEQAKALTERFNQRTEALNQQAEALSPESRSP